jgi:hypothetical protein
LVGLRNFEQAAYGDKKVPKINKASKKISKQKRQDEHFQKIQKKSGSRPDDYGEIDIQNRLGFKKKTQEQINKDKMSKGFSKLEQIRNSETFKEQPKMKDYLKQKIDKTKKLNMKKINTIKVKRVKQ